MTPPSLPSGPVHEDELYALARAVYEASPLTQGEIAERAGVHRVTVAKALAEGHSLTALRVRIIEICTGWKSNGPAYRFTK